MSLLFLFQPNVIPVTMASCESSYVNCSSVQTPLPSSASAAAAYKASASSCSNQGLMKQHRLIQHSADAEPIYVPGAYLVRNSFILLIMPSAGHL